MDDIKDSKASYKGGTNGAGVGQADLERGFSEAGSEFNETETPTFDQQQGGFLGRPKGWER
jgi:hypothetical protein